VARNLSFSKIHDLTELLAECRKADGTLENIVEDCDRLTDYYIEPRYPTAAGGGVTQEEADEARRAAQNIRDEIRKRLGL
jgi:HEPN domain-containing protein